MTPTFSMPAAAFPAIFRCAASRAVLCAAALLTVVAAAAPAAAAQNNAGVMPSDMAQDGTAAPESAAASIPGGQGQTFEVSPVNPLEPEGGNVWGVFSGFGFNQSINGSAGGINAATLGVRWSHMWGAKLGSLLRGQPAFGIEIVPLTAFVQRSETTLAGGLNLVYEHHFAVSGRVLPIWKLGAGFLYADKELPAGETRHNFTLLTELGIDIMVTGGSAIFVGYRFHHVSNANTGSINPGINLHTIMFGLSFYR